MSAHPNNPAHTNKDGMVTVNGAVYMLSAMYTMMHTASTKTNNLNILDLLGLIKGYATDYILA